MMFIHAARRAVDLLETAGRFDDIVELCSGALIVDPYDEFLHYHLIAALNRLGQPQAALNQYDAMSDLFFNNFGVTPSEEMAALYREIIKSNQKVEQDLQIIKDQLREKESLPGAFFCKYEFFKDIYRVQARAVARSGMSIYVCLITATDRQGNPLDGKALSAIMTRLGACVRESLRKGDVYSRYSAAQYIMMLPSVTYEDGRRVIERILNHYRGAHSLQDVSFSYNMETIESVR
jgi:tetratricopeptide (TPR) repeat protein